MKKKMFRDLVRFHNVQKNILENSSCPFVDVTVNSIEVRRLSDDCFRLNKMLYAESQLITSGASDKINIFDWPVKPSL